MMCIDQVLTVPCHQDAPTEPTELTIPPIRVLYADNCGAELAAELQLADQQSCLGWGDVVATLEEVMR